MDTEAFSLTGWRAPGGPRPAALPLGDRQPQGQKALFAHDRAGVYRVPHGHDTTSSVIVAVVDRNGVALGKPKRDPPVVRDPHGVVAAEGSLQGVKPEAGQIHAFGPLLRSSAVRMRWSFATRAGARCAVPRPSYRPANPMAKDLITIGNVRCHATYANQLAAALPLYRAYRRNIGPSRISQFIWALHFAGLTTSS